MEIQRQKQIGEETQDDKFNQLPEQVLQHVECCATSSKIEYRTTHTHNTQRYGAEYRDAELCMLHP